MIVDMGVYERIRKEWETYLPDLFPIAVEVRTDPMDVLLENPPKIRVGTFEYQDGQLCVAETELLPADHMIKLYADKNMEPKIKKVPGVLHVITGPHIGSYYVYVDKRFDLKAVEFNVMYSIYVSYI